MDRDRFAEALMAFGDTVNNAFGGKQNIYGTYVDQKEKRLKLEREATLAAQALEQQKFMNDIRLEQLNQSTQRVGLQQRGQDIALQKAAEAEKAKNIRAGLRPIDTAMSTSLGGRLPSKSVMGAYGQMYVPDNTMIDLAARKAAAAAQATTPVMVDRAKQVADYRAELQGSEKTPMSSDSAGRYAFAKEAIRQSNNMEKILFDKDGNFNQALVTKALGGKYLKDRDVQDFKRWSTGVLTAKGLIQSGTVLKDNEWLRLMNQYGVGFFSNAGSVRALLPETRQFFNEFLDAMKPSRDKGGKVAPSDGLSDDDAYAIYLKSVGGD